MKQPHLGICIVFVTIFASYGCDDSCAEKKIGKGGCGVSFECRNNEDFPIDWGASSEWGTAELAKKTVEATKDSCIAYHRCQGSIYTMVKRYNGAADNNYWYYDETGALVGLAKETDVVEYCFETAYRIQSGKILPCEEPCVEVDSNTIDENILCDEGDFARCDSYIRN